MIEIERNSVSMQPGLFFSKCKGKVGICRSPGGSTVSRIRNSNWQTSSSSENAQNNDSVNGEETIDLRGYCRVVQEEKENLATIWSEKSHYYSGENQYLVFSKAALVTPPFSNPLLSLNMKKNKSLCASSNILNIKFIF